MLVYLDDILVSSKTPSEHLVHLRKVLVALREAKLYCKLSKCLFCTPEVEYLGHLLTPDGIKMDPSKVHALVTWPTPTSVSQLKSFRGLLGYLTHLLITLLMLLFP